MAKGKDDIKIKVIMGCPGWMMTMGDCMSLLLCFFVLLLTFSTDKDEQLLKLLSFIQGASSSIKMDSKTIPDKKVQDKKEAEDDEEVDDKNKDQKVDKDNVSPITLNQYKFTHKKEELERKLHRLGFKKFVTLKLDQNGLMMEFEADKFFQKNTDVLLEYSKPVIEGFIKLAKEVRNEIRVSALMPKRFVSTNGKFSRNWRISVARVNKIGEVFKYKYSARPDRISYGTFIDDKLSNAKIQLLISENYGAKEIKPEDLTREILKFR